MVASMVWSVVSLVPWVCLGWLTGAGTKDQLARLTRWRLSHLV